MTLYRRLLLAVIVLVLFLLVANMVITLHNARLNLYEQMKAHSQDAATSLAFSLSQALQGDDKVQMALMIDAIFDHGYYRRILYRDVDGRVQLQRELPQTGLEVPLWFVRWLVLPEPVGVAQVSSGWYQLGEIEVVSHPVFAYKDLWRSFTEQLWLFLFTLVLCYGLLGIGVRMVLKPLRRVEAQADAICRKEFPIQASLPRIPELRQVVQAMNRMVEKVRDMFQHQVDLNARLHEQLNTDAVTCLANRQCFDQRLQAALSADRVAASGVLFFIRLSNLRQINIQLGRDEGDAYLKAVAVLLEKTLHKHFSGKAEYLLSRHSGADFAIFIPAMDEHESHVLMESIYIDLQSLQWQDNVHPQVAIGVLFMPELADAHDFMALADSALHQAEGEGGGCYWRKLGKGERPLSTHQWRDLIQQALATAGLGFHFQPVWQLHGGEKQLLFYEVMTRMTVDGKTYSAGTFMPMATRLQAVAEIDTAVIGLLSERLDRLPEGLCVNCSIAAVQTPSFLQAVELFLISHPERAKQMVFELPANSLAFSALAVSEFARLIKKYGASLSLHHFGHSSCEFAHLQALPVDYLKIDRHFIQNVAEDRDAQFFIRSLVAIASGCDLIILAEGVETQAQWQSLIDLGVQGGQGYWLGRPMDSCGQ